MDIVAFVGYMVLAAVFAVSIYIYESRAEYGKKTNIFRSVICGITTYMVLLIIYSKNIPAYVITVWYCFICFFVHWHRKKEARLSALVKISVRFVSSVTTAMIMIGISSIIMNVSPVDAMELKGARCGYFATCIISHLINNFAYHYKLFRRSWIDIFKQHPEESVALLRFTWSAVVFVILESIPLSVNRMPEAGFADYYLIVSNVLVHAVMLFSAFYTINIFLKENKEKEYFRLKTEQAFARQRQRELISTIYVDDLTGIGSRVKAIETMEQLCIDNVKYSVVFIDLDGLKRINDSEGHPAGDKYLIEFTKLLKERLDDQETFARVGGDEFVVVLPGYTEENAIARMKKIREELSDRAKFSFGVAESDNKYKTVDELIDSADHKMYDDKRRAV